MSTNENDLLHRSEAAEYLRLPIGTLSSWAYHRTGPEFFRIGRYAMYRRSELDAWIEQQRVGPSSRD